MNFFKRPIALLLLLLILEIKGQQQDITLTPQTPAYVEEGNAINLTCKSTKTSGIFNFFHNESGKVITYGIAGDAGTSVQCSDSKIPNVQLQCEFNDNVWIFVLTFSKPMHNQTIFCSGQTGGGFLIANSTIFVEVPVPEVILSPNDTVEVIENKNVSFVCLARGGRPAANITWHKGNITLSETSNKTKLNGSVYDVYSTLTTLFHRDDIGYKIKCSAVNIKNMQAVESTETLIRNVLYAPSTNPVHGGSGSLSVDEGQQVTLQCSLGDLGNPPIMWSWICGGKNLTGNATNSGKQSTLNFTADRQYDQKTCQCWATSQRLQYSRTSEKINITVFYAPTSGPLITMLNSLPVDEGHPVNFQCSLNSSSNPPITWSWVCGGDNVTPQVNNDTHSFLTITAKRTLNSRTCQCLATSSWTSLQYSEASGREIITVYYLPKYNPTITGSSLPVEEGQQVTFQCSLGDLGNPPIMWSWICGGRNLTKNASYSELKSTLNFTADRQYNKKACQCFATSLRKPLEYNRTSDNKIVTVYFPVEIKNVTFSEGSNNTAAGNHVKLVAIIDGNPESTVIWKIKDSNRTILQNESISTISELTFRQASCLDSNEYTVEAFNGRGNIVMKDIYLNILCMPYFSIDNEQDPIAIGDENQFVIKRKYIANPTAKVQWGKLDSENTTLKNESQHVTILNYAEGKVHYTTVLERKNVNDSDIGLYYLCVENSLGKIFSLTEVILKRSPDIPRNVYVNCDKPFEAKVHWTAGFDGGGNQTFFVLFSQQDWSTYKLSSTFVNGRRGDNKFITISDLQPNVKHEFKVYARNIYGNVSSTSFYCIIQDQGDSLPVIIGGAAAGGTILAVLCIIIVVLFKRYYYHGEHTGKSHRLDNVNENEEDGADVDGLKENSLYVSAGPRDDEKTEVAVYAAVAKKLPQSDNNSNLYADVKKSGRQETNKGTMSSEVKPKKGLFKKDEKAKHKKGKKPKNRPREADVYENSEDIAMSTNVENVYSNAAQKGQNKQKERGYKNKDGLLYVEVNFDGKQGQDNPIIHGEDEKTDYATVEFPMPSALHKASGSEEL